MKPVLNPDIMTMCLIKVLLTSHCALFPLTHQQIELVRIVFTVKVVVQMGFVSSAVCRSTEDLTVNSQPN